MPSNLLETRGLVAFYGDFQALFGIDFHIAPNETERRRQIYFP